MKHFLGSGENAQANASLTSLCESKGTHKGECKSFTQLEVTSVEDAAGGRKHHGQLFWANFATLMFTYARASLVQTPPTTTEQHASIVLEFLD